MTPPTKPAPVTAEKFGYAVVANGAVINFRDHPQRHRMLGAAYLHACHWKHAYDKRVIVEEHRWNPTGGGDGRGEWERTFNDHEIAPVEAADHRASCTSPCGCWNQ